MKPLVTEDQSFDLTKKILSQDVDLLGLVASCLSLTPSPKYSSKRLFIVTISKYLVSNRTFNFEI